jgi:signal transduction histidine kinase
VRQQPGPATSPALLYAPVPLLVGAAVRFGPWGASASMLTCALVAIRGAVAGQGPFVASSAVENALAIQEFLIIAWVPIMSLAAVIRERTHANASARSSEEQLAIALDAAQLGRWEWDIAASRLIWSDITRRLYEVPPGAPVTPETFERLIHPDDRHLLEAATASALAGGEVDVEFRVRFPDGRIKWIHSKGKTVFDGDGRPTRIVGVKVDVTRRKSAEIEIHAQRQQLAHVSHVAVAGEMSIALAHEMNQPLAAILANAAAARRFLEREPPDLRELGEIVEAIAHDNRRAAAIVARFNELQSRDDPRWVALDVNELVGGVIDVARNDIYSRGVSLTTCLAPAMPRVLGDAIQLQQVVLNLLVNACDAMDSVDASGRRLTVATSAARGVVSVIVTDTGTGVPEEERDRIFEPFVTTKPQRVGLGLAICRSILSAHGGTLTAENLPHGGASFECSLPSVVDEVARSATA